MQQQQEQEQTPYTYDRDARAMCDALARALRVSYVIINHVYETRLFPRAEAFASLDDARDALVRALREYEYEAEACERARSAQRLAERRRQQQTAEAKKRAAGATRRSFSLASCDARRRRQRRQ